MYSRSQSNATTSASMRGDHLAWTPLISIERDGIIERTFHGIISVVELQNNGLHDPLRTMPVIQAGDIDALLWGRSLLKPWQLLSIYPFIKHHHSNIEDDEVAMMMASHQGDEGQLKILSRLEKRLERQIVQSETPTSDDESSALPSYSNKLDCPSCFPMSAGNATELKLKGLSKSKLFHPCSGKHLGHLMSGIALPESSDANKSNYLSPAFQPYQDLSAILSRLLLKNQTVFQWTTDGCGMPNPALTTRELAFLFALLLQECPIDDETMKTAWRDIARIMREQANLVGGEGRLDTFIMQGGLSGSAIPMIAKEGADGLLAIGVAPNDLHPNGLGICIKLAQGYSPADLRLMSEAVLMRLGYINRISVLEKPLTLIPHFDNKS